MLTVKVYGMYYIRTIKDVNPSMTIGGLVDRLDKEAIDEYGDCYKRPNGDWWEMDKYGYKIDKDKTFESYGFREGRITLRFIALGKNVCWKDLCPGVSEFDYYTKIYQSIDD